MAVISLTPTVESRAEKQVKPTNLGKEDFLKLLVAQLQHQDPLNPMDSVEFTAQLAQFSALEQQRNTNENLEKLIAKQDFSNQVSMCSVIGKNILAYNNEITVSGEKEIQIGFELSSEAKSATVTITDSVGRVIRVLNISHPQKGINKIAWDGKDASGVPVPSGNYYFTAKAILADKSTEDGRPCVEGRVSEVGYENGTPYLMVGGRKIALAQVVKVMEGETQAEGGQR